jgi:hypothetical protein
MRLHLFTTDAALRRMQRQVADAPEHRGVDADLGRLDVPREHRRQEFEDAREIRLHAPARQLGYLLVATPVLAALLAASVVSLVC